MCVCESFSQPFLHVSVESEVGGYSRAFLKYKKAFKTTPERDLLCESCDWAVSSADLYVNYGASLFTSSRVNF